MPSTKALLRFLVVLVGFCSAVQAQTARLNAHFEYESVVGDVLDFELKVGGSFLFFRADERRAGTYELFAASALGTTPIRRENRLLLPERSVIDYEPSPVGNWIVFRADQDQDEVFELYSRTITDAAPRKLNGPLVAGGDVASFAIAPNGARVVYAASQDSSSSLELYSVPIDGSTSPVKLSGTMVPGAIVSQFTVSPTSSRVVFRANKDAIGRYELYSAPIDGSASPVKLNLPLPPSGHVAAEKPAITTDGAWVVFRAHVTSSAYGLYRSSILMSSTPVRLNAPPGSGDFVGEFAITADDQRVVYTAATAPGVMDLYSVPLDASEVPARLSPPFPHDGGVRELALSPDGDRVAFSASQGSESIFLYVAPTDPAAGGLTVLDVPPGGREFVDLVVTPDSERVVYLVREPVFFDQRSLGLRSVPLDASAGAVRLDAAGGFPSTSFSGAIGVLNGVPFAVSADSSRVIYLWYPTGASNEDVASRGLYSVRVDGSAAPLTLRAGGVSYDIATSLVGSRAYFVADATGAAVDTLYGIDLLGTNLVQISDKLARDTFSDVSVPTPTPTAAYALVDGGERVVHAADATVDQRFELFSGRTDGGSLPQPLGSGGLVSGLRTSPDGSRAVYSDGDLYSVPTDGSGPRVKLFDGPSADELIADNFQVSPDGARVVFRSSFESGPERLLSVPSAGGTAVELEDDHVLHFVLGASRAVYVIIDSSLNHRLFSVPMDGSSAPIPLDGNNLPDNGRPVLTPDLTHAVYNSGFGVAIVPVDGSSGPLVLSGTPYTYGPRVSPDGQWVVFSQRPSLFQFIFELYSARLDGSSGPLKLNAPLVSGGNLVTSNDSAAFAISPDSTRVVYVADQEQDERFELYSVPIDDSVSPVKLNEPLPVGGDVYAVGPDYEHVQIAPDSSRVVYVADQNVNDRLELYSVPLAGGPTIPLNGTFVSGGNIAVGSGAPFLISPDSSLVVYRADQTIDNLFDIFLVPIDRFFEPRALTGGFARPGVTFPTITPDSRRVVYQATERLGVTELFSSALSFIPERNHLKNGDARRP